MSTHLLLPGLVWPAATAIDLTKGLALPSLEALLGHARIRREPARSLEDWLAGAFGVPADAVPHAPLRRLGEADDARIEGHWLCADPVHLHFAREHLLLTDASNLDISPDEATALLKTLNDFFAEVEPGLGRFEAGSPSRWYLRLTEPARARFAPLGEVIGRPVAHFLPEGDDARRWQQLASEAQILLHNHPVNRVREESGRRSVNSVWLWGGGTLPGSLSAPAPRVQSGHVFARGLARAAGIDIVPSGPMPAGDALVVIDDLHAHALHLDIELWRDTLQRLETDCFAPLLAALKSGRMRTLRITAPGDRATLEMELGARGFWKFWQRPRTLDSLLGTLS